MPSHGREPRNEMRGTLVEMPPPSAGLASPRRAVQRSNSPRAIDESVWRAIPRPSLASGGGLRQLDAWTAASERGTRGGGSVLVPQGVWLALRFRPEPRPSQSRGLGAFGRAPLCADEDRP